MTKMIKMSLIAAVAVAGLTTTASAQNLEDAIKGVDFSGNLRYRYTNGEANLNDQNEYQLNMTVKSKVNDMVTATVSTSTATDQANVATSDTSGDADPVAAKIAEANFAFALPGATIIAGKQALATPFADGSVDSQQGTGVVALVPVAGVTLAGGLFLNSDAKSNVYGVDLNGNNIAAVAAIGKASVVDYAAWYAKVSENTVAVGVIAGATAMNLNLKAPVGPVNVEVNYAKVDYTVNGADGKAPTQSRVVVSGDVAGVSLAAGYVKAGKDGGDVTLGDGDATANFVMEAFGGTALKDSNAFYLAASAPVGPVTAKIEYGTSSDYLGAGTGDVSETKLSVAYAMSKNFNISAWATDCGGKLDGSAANRIELNYTF
jgi:hypothetical protein